jgi:hypothetical protein
MNDVKRQARLGFDSNGEIKDPVLSLPEKVKAGILFQKSSREQANFHGCDQSM